MHIVEMRFILAIERDEQQMPIRTRQRVNGTTPDEHSRVEYEAADVLRNVIDASTERQDNR